MAGSLFVVATPIGNLEDLTFRALRILRQVDLIAAEDTRRTSRLLAHYGVSKPLVSLHEHNERQVSPRLVTRMEAGESVALVSDAGTPGISDPGAGLVQLCRDRGLTVEAIPGPSAVTAALSVSGLAAVPFTFVGFPPATGSARMEWLASLADMPHTVVLFEAPHRIRRTITDLAKSAVRPILVFRELTKIHMELVVWSTTDLDVADLPDKGEFVVVLGPIEHQKPSEIDGASVLLTFDAMAGITHLTSDQVLAATAAAFNLPPQKVRSVVKKARILVKQQTKSSA